METKAYAKGSYTRLNLAHKKVYIPTLYTMRGELLRHSLKRMKTAVLARHWAIRWARKVNERAGGKYPIFAPTESVLRNLEHRKNLYFETLG